MILWIAFCRLPCEATMDKLRTRTFENRRDSRHNLIETVLGSYHTTALTCYALQT
jgi:hypothetical protein